jgi:hypothetical protein
METGGEIFRRIEEAMLVPDVRVSRTNKNPPSRYGFIQRHREHLFSGLSDQRKICQISCKIRHRFGCSFWSSREKTEGLPASRDFDRFALAELLRDLAESFLKLSSIHLLHVRQIAGHFPARQDCRGRGFFYYFGWGNPPGAAPPGGVMRFIIVSRIMVLTSV